MTTRTREDAHAQGSPASDGEMGALISAHDWTTTSLGAIAGWPERLKAFVDLALASLEPMFVAVGTDLVLIYNDALAPLLGGKHPQALGAPFPITFAEIMDELQPLLDATLDGRQQSMIDHRFSLPWRREAPEGWFTFRLTPVHDAAGDTYGLVAAISETTDHVRAYRAQREAEERQAFLLKLSDTLRACSGAQSIKEQTVMMLAEHLRLDRCYVSEVFEQEGFSTVGPEQVRPGLPPMAGVYRLADYPETMRRLATQPLVIHDADNDPRFSESQKAMLAKVPQRALLVAPLRKGPQEVIWALAGAMATPRDWTEGERVLLEEVAERTWAAVERARAEEALRESERRFRALITAGAYAMYRMSPDWSEMRYLGGQGFITDMVEPIESWLDVYVIPEDWPQIRAAICEAIREKRVFALEHRVRRMDGTVGWTSSRAVPLLDEHGEIVEWVGAASDITDRKTAEQALHESEEKYRVLFDSIDEGFCTIEVIFDEDGRPTDYRFLDVNKAFERQTGIAGAVGRRMREIAPLHEQHWFDIYGRVALTGEPVRFEERAEQLGRVYDVYAFPTGDPAERRVGILFHDIAERKRLEAQRERMLVTEAVAVERQALLKRVVLAQEEERRRLSHEVHDSVAQIASAAALRLDDLTERLASNLDEADLRDLERARDLTRATAVESRRLIAGLRPEVLDQFGLARAIAHEVELLRNAGWKATFRDGTVAGERFPDEIEITLYRVAQEALMNIHHHAGPTSVQVRLARADRHLRLTVQDRGRGFDPAASSHDGRAGDHLGLVGMRERVALLGGRFTIRSAPGAGTRIEVTLPARLPATGAAANG